MGVSWTKEQQMAIQLRGRNILVSAAAGSGKTAVLVERIVQKALDKEHPVDIDRMLIVTFTRAAAAQMRERVGLAIEKRMEKQPDSAFLQRQYTLVHNAQITTIDSFCLYVVRSYFQTIDLEPSFRIADTGELKLMRADVIKEVLEEYYTNKDADFLQLVDCYATAKSDAPLVDFVQKLYDFSQSYPWPQEYLASLADGYAVADGRALDAQPWMAGLLAYISHIVSDLTHQMEYARCLCADADGPGMYEAAVLDDLGLLAGFAQCKTYEDYARHFLALSYTKLGVNRKYSGSVEKQEQVKKLRKTMKDALAKLAASYFYQDTEKLLADIRDTAPSVRALAKLTQSFADAYRAKKADKNVLDFSDIEHLALDILIDKSSKKPTAAARELRGVYEEIMIDEYQDSNYVQETILRAVSKEEEGCNNIFMVGDVKQSIYRFRLARPELFIEKYKTYTGEDSDRQKVELAKNFRSRREVVESINRIFYKIMHEDLGNVEYDKQSALYAAATTYPAPKEQAVFKSELLLADAGEDALAQSDMHDAKELEARMVAARIRELLDAGQVKDENTGELRRVRCRDIVLLFRSISGWADIFARELTKAGIPAHTTSQTGYFSATEIRTVLAMLSVLDNPLQDIPIAAVLASPIGGFDGEELARVRTESREHFYYLALRDYAAYGREDALREKAAGFVALVEKLRAVTSYTPIHKLIRLVLQTTGYDSYIAAMPEGAQRRANIDMLLDKAIAYEKTSYKGLFHFVQYIEKLKKYEVDFGEADITGENDDVVRLMSIHKSKGLEFPVVFVCGMCKQFNRQDVRSRMILHPEYGIGLDCVDTKLRVRRPGFIKKVLENQTQIENQGEELRVLYVALTRAQEKLIMTGAVKDGLPDVMEERYKDRPMDYLSRYRASSYFDWVYPAAATDRMLFDVRMYTCEQLNVQAAVEAALGRLDLLHVKKLYKTADKALCADIDEKLSWQYPFLGDTTLKTKISVSELKRKKQVLSEEPEPAVELIVPEKKPQIPAFLRGEEQSENLGALRGSAFHKALEEIDFISGTQSADKTAEVKAQLAHMRAQGHITEQMQRLVRPRTLAVFLESSVAGRMACAQQAGVLQREQPFVMGIPADEVYADASGELVLIQGIVDVCWKEADGLVILDYKTDAVKEPSVLVSRYTTQLSLYAQALERATDIPVKEKLIYSFHLQELIRL